MQNLQAYSARPIKDGDATMGKTHLKPWMVARKCQKWPPGTILIIMYEMDL